MTHFPLQNLYPRASLDAAHQLFGADSVFPILLPKINWEVFKSSHHYDLLHLEEQAKAATFTLEKRREEFITGRLCARQALLAYLANNGLEVPDVHNLEIRVDNDEAGRPFFSSHNTGSFQVPSLTIAHSGNYAVANISPKHLFTGIDIQNSEKTLQRIEDRFCSDTEKLFLRGRRTSNETELRALNRIWSAKEAARKLLGNWKLPGFLELDLCEVEPMGDGLLVLTLANKMKGAGHAPTSLTILSTAFENYCMALTICPAKPGGEHA